MFRHWRSLRAQVLLWTVLPLTILLITVSLTGIGTHQASMRALAADDNAQLARTLASALAQQVDTYMVGLEAAASLIAHHAGNEAMRDFHLDETSAVLGGIALVALDAQGRPLAAAGNGLPIWASDAALLARTAAGAPTATRNLMLIRVDLPNQLGALVAAVPMAEFAASLDAVATMRSGVEIAIVEGEQTLLAAGGAVNAATHAVAGDETPHMTTGPTDNPASADWLVATAAVEGTPWHALLREPWNARKMPLIRFEQAMPFVLAIAAAVSFLTLYFGLRLVVQPLRQLETSARLIGNGDFTAAAAPVGGVDEIENVRTAMNQMAQQLASSQRALERYLYATTQAQEEERARLARELHDETVQGLIALDHRLQKAQRTLLREPSMLKDEVAELRQMVRQAMEEVRRFSLALRPVYLEDLGLCPALELLARDLGVDYRMTGEQRRLEPAFELALYRIAQESINNARRHARAHQITLELAFTSDQVSLSIADDGVGFALPRPLSSLSRNGHFGLMGIQERTELIGAQLEIDSAEGRGTTIRVRLAA